MLKGVLLDVGHTIAYPPSGNWFLPPSIGSLLQSYGLRSLDLQVLSSAVGKGLEYLKANHHVVSEEAELDQFRAFFGILLREAGVHDPPDGLIDDLARLHVTTNENFALYPDVIPALDKLKALGLRLGILSDNWPSLRRRLADLGIADYFMAVAISAELGSGKPHEPIYQSAAGGIGLRYDQLLFVDDFEENLAAGRRLGMDCVQIQRDATGAPGEFAIVSTMPELVSHIGAILTGKTRTEPASRLRSQP